MGAFNNVYDETTPPGSALANTLDTVIQTDKKAIDERIELEHISLVDGTNDTTSATAQGRHNPGYVSAVYVGTTAEIALLSGMQSGAMAFDTDTGELQIYNGVDWDTRKVSGTPTETNGLAFSAYQGSAQTTTQAWEALEIDTEESDPASVFDTTTYKYTPAKTGLYQIDARVDATNAEALECAIYVNGALYQLGSQMRDSTRTTESAVYSGIVRVTNIADYLQLYARLQYATGIYSAGATKTFFQGYRIASI